MINGRSHRVIVALVTSLATAAIMTFLVGETGALPFAGWAIFFASLQYAYVFPEHGRRCSAWLRRIRFRRPA